MALGAPVHRGPGVRREGVGRAELVALIAVVVLGLALRLPLAVSGGEFDADQGRDMSIVRGILAGDLPLEGPVTSIGIGRHGVLYYYLLVPWAMIDGAAGPGPVQGFFLVLGMATILLVWALARLAGGPVAGLLAAAVVACSAAAVGASTTIWNPNITPFGSALAFLGAYLALRGEPRWWLLAGLGALVVGQGHILGGLIVVPLGALVCADLLRKPGRRRPILALAAGGALLFAGGYLPFLVSDAAGGFAEVRRIAAYVLGAGAAGGGTPTLDPFGRALLALIRITSVPLAGPLSASYLPNALATTLVVAAVAIVLRGARGETRLLAAAVVGAAVTVVAVLALVLGQATVIPNLPTDHFHEWLDPLVHLITGLGLARLVPSRSRRVGGPGSSVRDAVGTALGAAPAVALLCVVGWWNVIAAPPVAAADDWRSVKEAVARAAADERDVTVLYAPSFKGADAYRYALAVTGREPVEPADARRIVIVCEASLVAGCGGPAEDRILTAAFGPGPAPALRMIDRFVVPPDRTISVFEVRPR